MLGMAEGGVERLLLPIGKMPAQDRGALHAAIVTGRDPVGCLGCRQRFVRIARVEMRPAQDVDDAGLQFILGDRPYIKRHLEGSA